MAKNSFLYMLLYMYIAYTYYTNLKTKTKLDKQSDSLCRPFNFAWNSEQKVQIKGRLDCSPAFKFDRDN